MLDLRDIAHALSLLCRGNGHVSHFYSVAQHSINCALEAKARGCTATVQGACLLHDAAEGYMADLTRPLKATMPAFRQAEDALLEVIWEKYLGCLSDEERRQVFAIDDAMMSHEFMKLMPELVSEQYRELQSEPATDFENPEIVEKRFLQMCRQLCREENV